MNDRPPPDTCELDRIEGGDALETWARRWLHHLQTGCRSCWSYLVDASKPSASALDESDIARLLRKAQEEVPDIFHCGLVDHAEANQLVDRLVGMSPEHQKLVIANSKRSCNPAVCDALIDRSLGTRFVNETATLILAELAVQVARGLSATQGSASEIRALTTLGAARRSNSDLGGAARALEEAERLLGDRERDPLLLAEVWSIRAALLTDRGRFSSALRLLKRASSLYVRTENLLLDAHSKLRLGNAYRYSGNFVYAFQSELEALKIGRRLYDQPLKLLTLHNLIATSINAGDLETAGRWLNDARPLFKAAAPLRLRRHHEWVDATYTCARGWIREGVRRLIELREEFRGLGLLASLSSISLELATIYLQLGRRSSARPLLLELLDISRELEIKNQSQRALSLLQG